MVKWIIILLLFTTNHVEAQDLILKRSGELIYCNIESVEDYFIHFYELADTNKLLLYKMDAVLVSKISFSDEGQIPFFDDTDVITDNALLSTPYFMLETNVDGIFNGYSSLHFQFLRPKYALDIGLKIFSSPDNLFFQSTEDKGSMFELGVSLPLKMLGEKDRPLRGIFIRGFCIYTSGTFSNRFQQFFVEEYNQFSFGLQGVFHYQISKSFYVKAYYGLGGTIQIGSFGPPTRRADLSGSDGVQNIFGVRFGFIF